MRRFRGRPRSSARRRPNLNWTGFQSIRNTISAGGAIAYELYDGTNAMAVGLSPVLQRIRGSFVCDPDINPDEEAPQFWTVYGYISVGVAPAATWSNDALSAETVIWAGLLHASSRNVLTIQGAGTDPNVDLLGQYVINHDVTTFDVKAKRKMENYTSIWLELFANASNTSGVEVSGVFRTLMAT